MDKYEIKYIVIVYIDGDIVETEEHDSFEEAQESLDILHEQMEREKEEQYSIYLCEVIDMEEKMPTKH